MELSRFERVLLKLEKRAERVSSKIAGELKNVKPFDMEPVSKEEQLAKYMSLEPQVKEQLRQSMPEVWGEHEAKMNDLIRSKYGL